MVLVAKHGHAAVLGCVLVVALACQVSAGTINLEWRPLSQTVNVGDPLGVGLYAVSGTGQTELFNSAQVIVTWETAYLQLTGVSQAGAVLVPPGDASSFSPGDSFGFNESNPPGDGDGLWFGFVSAGGTRQATPAGALLTTVLFNALAETTGTPVTMLYSGQKPGRPMAESEINQGTFNVLGTLGAPAIITIVPEPMSSTLFLLGTLLWVGRRR